MRATRPFAALLSQSADACIRLDIRFLVIDRVRPDVPRCATLRPHERQSRRLRSAELSSKIERRGQSRSRDGVCRSAGAEIVAYRREETRMRRREFIVPPDSTARCPMAARTQKPVLPSDWIFQYESAPPHPSPAASRSARLSSSRADGETCPQVAPVIRAKTGEAPLRTVRRTTATAKPNMVSRFTCIGKLSSDVQGNEIVLRFIQPYRPGRRNDLPAGLRDGRGRDRV